MIFNMVSGSAPISMVGSNSSVRTGTAAQSGGVFYEFFSYTVSFTTPGIYYATGTALSSTTNNEYGVVSFFVTGSSNASYEKIGSTSMHRIIVQAAGATATCSLSISASSSTSSDTMKYRAWISVIGPAAVTIT